MMPLWCRQVTEETVGLRIQS